MQFNQFSYTYYADVVQKFIDNNEWSKNAIKSKCGNYWVAKCKSREFSTLTR